MRNAFRTDSAQPTESNYEGLRIGNTYDSRRKININNDSMNLFLVNENISPKDSLTLKHSKELIRKTNKTPISRYVKTTKVSAVGMTNLYRNQVSMNFISSKSSSK